MTSPARPSLLAGAATADLTPSRSCFLYGYPHVSRMSSGVHDPLLASALALSDGHGGQAIFVACDLIWVPKDLAGRARDRIAADLGLTAADVMISATHTHSGPVTDAVLSNAADPVVPPPDPDYLRQLERTLVQVAIEAHRALRPARLSLGVADTAGLGTNRRDPAGPSIPRAPVLVAREIADDQPIAVMTVVSMHPTVLHEDSTLISGDFPGLARRWLQGHGLGASCPFVYHMGAAGNQSPRHVVKSNTLDEAQRLGEQLGRAVLAAIKHAQPIDPARVRTGRVHLDDLPVRTFPAPADAEAAYHRARDRFEQLQRDGAPRTAVRTAECDVFGAEETLTLARAAEDGRLHEAARGCLPAEIQVIRIGTHSFVGWPGEVFVEFALDLMARFDHAWIITVANGGMQGYLVTQEAVDEGGYEASNALFASPHGGQRFVEASAALLATLTTAEASHR